MKEYFNLPNVLTYIRIALIPVFVILFFSVTPIYQLPLAIFVLASVTDAIDGFIARRYNLITNIGKVLDPFADKLLKITVLFCFVSIDIIPLWFVLAMLVFDLTLIIAASILFKKEIVIKSNIIGKSGTTIISLGLILSFFHEKVYDINLYILYLGLLVVFCSCISYLLIYLKTKKEK